MAWGRREAYHATQIETFADTAADMVTAITMNYVEEAIGVARAPRACDMPVGHLVHGRDRRAPADRADAERPRSSTVDDATSGIPAYYMINCAHPTHFASALDEHAAVDAADPRPARQRVAPEPRRAQRGPDLDIGNPAELGREHAELKRRLPRLNVMGGCCGTDTRHVGEIAAAGLALRGRSAA